MFRSKRSSVGSLQVTVGILPRPHLGLHCSHYMGKWREAIQVHCPHLLKGTQQRLNYSDCKSIPPWMRGKVGVTETANLQTNVVGFLVIKYFLIRTGWCILSISRFVCAHGWVWVCMFLYVRFSVCICCVLQKIPCPTLSSCRPDTKIYWGKNLIGNGNSGTTSVFTDAKIKSTF